MSDSMRESHGEMVASFGGAAEVRCVNGDVDILVHGPTGTLLGRAVIRREYFPALMCELRKVERERFPRGGQSMSDSGRQMHDGDVTYIEPFVETNAAGGKQSHIANSLTQFQPRVALAVGRVLATGGAKYGRANWKLIPVEDHLDHAIRHIYTFLDKRTPGDLVNAICRLSFAAWLATVEKPESINEVSE